MFLTILIKAFCIINGDSQHIKEQENIHKNVKTQMNSVLNAEIEFLAYTINAFAKFTKFNGESTKKALKGLLTDSLASDKMLQVTVILFCTVYTKEMSEILCRNYNTFYFLWNIILNTLFSFHCTIFNSFAVILTGILPEKRNLL